MPRKKAEPTKAVKSVKKIKTPSVLRGFKDILPGDQKYWWLVFDKLRQMANEYSYGRILLPILEETKLFLHTVGKDTDVVSKELYSFDIKDGVNVSLRPEVTASIARAYINHGMLNQSQPVKLFYFGPMFRHDRPQSGRYRQFNQLGFEAIGEQHPVLDAQMAIIAYKLCTELGIESEIQINSIGCPSCRSDFKKNLVAYYKTQKRDLCLDCKERLTKNPLRLLDCKEEKCQMIREDAPQILDWICEECKNHFFKVLEYLDEVGVIYELNPYLVRGLDYYSKTVFEIFAKDSRKKGQNALGGGGRYDDLIEMLGGRPTPGVGMALGVERIILKLKELEVKVEKTYKPDVLVGQLGEQAKRKAMQLFEQLRAEGVKVAECFSKDGLKNQLEVGNKLGVKYCLIIGQQELSEGTIIIRDMDGGVQEIVNYDKVIKEIKKRLAQ